MVNAWTAGNTGMVTDNEDIGWWAARSCYHGTLLKAHQRKLMLAQGCGQPHHIASEVDTPKFAPVITKIPGPSSLWIPQALWASRFFLPASSSHRGIDRILAIYPCCLLGRGSFTCIYVVPTFVWQM